MYNNLIYTKYDKGEFCVDNKLCDLQNLTFPPDFFYDEERCGFYVSEMMKRFWAAQLVVLSEIDKICRRHDIKWYADMGTLIGAIRHKGFIPWDDDLDISILCDDWERFFECARKELPEGYKALTVHDDEEYTLALGRITNGNTINCDPEHLKKFYGCPYAVGVDVFAMDRIYNDPKKEEDRSRRGKDVAKASKLISQKGTEDQEVRSLLADIERDNHVILHRKGNLSRELVLLFEKIMKECRDEDAREVASMYVWITGHWANVPIEVYKECMLAEFEGTRISISTRYDQVLKIYYGDYMTVKRGKSAHAYPCYKEQEQILAEHLGHNPYRYTFEKEKFTRERRFPRYRDNFIKPVSVLVSAHKSIDMLFEAGNISGGAQMIQGCQDAAVALGNLIENRFGDGTQAVKKLENYCEMVYENSQNWSEMAVAHLDSGIREVEEEISKLFETRKRILFLPCRAKWWDTMKPLYEKVLASGYDDVSVIPIPYYDCDYLGNIGGVHDEGNSFPRDEHFTSFDEYNLIDMRPDEIVIQVPYDGWSCSITVPEKLYSDELLKYTDELVYIPCFDIMDPESDKDTINTALRTFIEQPAVVNADKVILKSEKIRNLYVSVMTELAGEETRDYWEQKMCLLR